MIARENEQKARYVMIGGFLGAGKTTAVAKFARHLVDRGLKVGLITNDQSQGLVDTGILRSRGFDVEEISGGCFCCRFDSLNEAAGKLNREFRPDVFIAEPVGSCTDLVATVSYPLRRLYGERFSIAPLSVLVDPERAGRILGILGGRSFSQKVAYVYRKQLEEARTIVINKCDDHEAFFLNELEARLKDEFPRARLRRVSAKEGSGLVDWFEDMLQDGIDLPTMELDYDEYAQGEALLGWLNATYRVTAGVRSSSTSFDANALLVSLTERVRDALAQRDREIAHLKLTLDSPDAGGQLSVVSLVRTDGQPDLRESLLDRVGAGCLVLNLRAEADPCELEGVVEEALASMQTEKGLAITREHIERFRPARPTPTHRIEVQG